jgi:hypothetical protein
MQFCRAAPSVAPENYGVSGPMRVAITEHIPVAQAKVASAAPDGIFRPPRTI